MKYYKTLITYTLLFFELVSPISAEGLNQLEGITQKQWNKLKKMATLIGGDGYENFERGTYVYSYDLTGDGKENFREEYLITSHFFDVPAGPLKPLVYMFDRDNDGSFSSEKEILIDNLCDGLNGNEIFMTSKDPKLLKKPAKSI